MVNNSPIGFFDSGVGGLSVYSKFKKVLPNENTLYFGDLANLPYGNKSRQELIGFAGNILNFFQSKGVKAVVIACNTSSALAYDSIKNNYDFKIYPIIQSCAKVISGLNVNKIGVFATKGTVDSAAYSKEIQEYNSSISVREIACPNWVSFVENGLKDWRCKEDVKLHLDEMLKFNPDKIILGCTHYPYLTEILTEFAPKDLFVDPAEIFVNFIKKDLTENELLSASTLKGSEHFYVSANPKAFLENSKLFYKLEKSPQLQPLG